MEIKAKKKNKGEKKNFLRKGEIGRWREKERESEVKEVSKQVSREATSRKSEKRNGI